MATESGRYIFCFLRHGYFLRLYSCDIACAKMNKDDEGTWWTTVRVSSNVDVAHSVIIKAGLRAVIINSKEIMVLADDVGEVIKILSRLSHVGD